MSRPGLSVDVCDKKKKEEEEDDVSNQADRTSDIEYGRGQAMVKPWNSILTGGTIA